MKARDLEATVRDLRKALEPEATRVEDIPPFDVAKAYALYAALLAPVESGWKDAKSLVVVRPMARWESCRSACCRPRTSRWTRRPNRCSPAIAPFPGWRARIT